MFLFLIVALIVLILGIRFYLKTQSPKYKGEMGESIVSNYLNELPKNEYKVFNNIYLNIKGSSIQIDHLIVSLYGIFVIETKNYNGWIFGSENQKYWTQIIFENRYKFKNPIKQNISHINTVKYILSKYSYLKYFPIIVFTGSGELKNINTSTPVIYESQLYHYILRSKEEQIIDHSQMEYIVSLINENLIYDKDIEQKHVQNIYQRKYINKEKINSLICPKCNGSLLIRNGSYGKFYGCSNYPNCRFTSNY